MRRSPASTVSVGLTNISASLGISTRTGALPPSVRMMAPSTICALPSNGAMIGSRPLDLAAKTSPVLTLAPSLTLILRPSEISIFSERPAVGVIWTTKWLPSSQTSTRPETGAIQAWPFGERASRSSSTRGRPRAIAPEPATPELCLVSRVSWVPSSPRDWAAITPIGWFDSISLRVARSTP